MRRIALLVAGMFMFGTVATTQPTEAAGLTIPPDPPTALTSTAFVGGATLTWQAPLNEGDSPVSDYVVSVWTAATDGTLVTQCTAVAPSVTCDVSLANGVEYFADVVANSLSGSSTASTPRVLTVGIWLFDSAPTPIITGLPTNGKKLSATVGTWAPAPVALTVRWLRAGVAIPGAIGLTYTLTSADVGKKISVSVTGTKVGYQTTTQTSANTASVVGLSLTAAPIPVIAGVARFGQRLTAKPGTWGPAPITLKYAWLRNGVAIPGATGATYLISPADVGRRISVRVTGSRLGYTSLARTSTSTVTVAPLLLTVTPTPLIIGPPKVGNRLAAKPGTWGPSPVTLTYTWLKNGVAIKGAKQASYVIAPNDAGAKISVKVIGARPGYKSIAKYSAATATVSITVRIPSDGIRRVGIQVASGTYVTVSKSTSSCYWERLSGLGGSFNEIIANNFASGQHIVTVLPTDKAFSTERCGAWYKLGDIPVAQKTTIPGGGIWSVSKQVKPGLYRANGSGTCYWARLSGFTGDFNQIITNNITSTRGSLVSVSSTDVGLETSAGCGTWTKVG